MWIVTLTLKASNMVLACNRVSCHIILKSHQARQSYEVDTEGFYVAYEQSLSTDYDSDL